MQKLRYRKLCFFFFVLIILSVSQNLHAENGYRLWLRYDVIENKALLEQYRSVCRSFLFAKHSPTLSVAETELKSGLQGMLGENITPVISPPNDGCILIGTPEQSSLIASLAVPNQIQKAGEEGFCILSTKIKGKNGTVITANTDIGLLYGVFRFLQLMQTHQPITHLSVVSAPKLQKRILDHWDNLDGTIERGYAGTSIWKWNELPGKTDQRYIDYARANASLGINGTVLNNVNADPQILTPEYLVKVQALANVFRSYGIKVYLTPPFSAPVTIGGLKTADPLDSSVIAWWNDKVQEIYRYIPDFGGFCVKANSEGQPGPQDYSRSHADGANMLADALAPHGGVVMWRAFVYNNKALEDRTKEAYNEFKPLDGAFHNNVLLQVKNGPIDFQPREPFSPLFGAMPRTPLMLEFQITQEYLGFSTYLVYLGSLYEECLQSDTYAEGKGATVANMIEGDITKKPLSGMAGVANIGSDSNWTGHPFAAANWFAFGRFAWNPNASAAAIADEWLRLTFTNEKTFVSKVKEMMMQSRQTAVNYICPLGLTMLMDITHYRPAPWRRDKPQPIGTKESFHRADSFGIGFNRTATGSNAVDQYFPAVAQTFSNVNTCPETFLLWFHHLPWRYQMKSGRTLWDELCLHYYAGVDSVRAMQKTWVQMKKYVDQQRFEKVNTLLAAQEKETVIWRNACVLYFQTFSHLPIPEHLPKPEKPLDYYKHLPFEP